MKERKIDLVYLPIKGTLDPAADICFVKYKRNIKITSETKEFKIILSSARGGNQNCININKAITKIKSLL